MSNKLGPLWVGLLICIAIGLIAAALIWESTMNEPSEQVENISTLNVPYVHQTENNWCGPASLEMVLRYWGVSVNQENIAPFVINPDDNLAHSGDMVEYAENLGFSASYGSMTIEELKENIDNKHPVIVLQWASRYDKENSHFRVVVDYNEQKIITHDPALKPNYPFTYEEFFELWLRENYTENESIIISPSQ